MPFVTAESSGPTPESWPANATLTPAAGVSSSASVTVPVSVPVGPPGAGGSEKFSTGCVSPESRVEAK